MGMGNGNGTEADTETEIETGNGIANFCRQTARRHTTGKAEQEQQERGQTDREQRGDRDALCILEVSENERESK